MDENVSKIRRCMDDRISELPDPILGKIISYLPTKNAVATSILSTRWKNVFPFDLPLINIDLDDSLLLNPGRNESDYFFTSLYSSSFIDFGDKLFNETLRDVPCVDTFTLTCANEFSEDKYIDWIRSAVRLSVRELQLKSSAHHHTYSLCSLFNTINRCTTLTRLVLTGESDSVYETRLVFFNSATNFRLPTLGTLELFCVAFRYDYHQVEVEEYTLTTLISCCPALEELSLTDCDLDDVSDIHIVSPVLKTLRIRNCLENERDITINTPNLEMLLLSSRVANHYSIYPFNSLRLGIIDDGQPWFLESVRDLVFDCRKTRNIYLALSSVEHLRFANKPHPEFQVLTRLSLDSVRSEGWVGLAWILNNAPNLEQLTFEEEFQGSDMGFSDFIRLVPIPPTCLELHIRNAEFRHFDKKEDVIKLLDYFVQTGKVLEKIVLNSVVIPVKR